MRKFSDSEWTHTVIQEAWYSTYGVTRFKATQQITGFRLAFRSCKLCTVAHVNWLRVVGIGSVRQWTQSKTSLFDSAPTMFSLLDKVEVSLQHL
ncbi:MAG: hypothetical protein BVN35_18645 [Proteobacteria bacterium ST_bin11]|nr:MAG: hypothetical protein BVN35_18645 [Proteobacteria bacterium ST_bin11]